MRKNELFKLKEFDFLRWCFKECLRRLREVAFCTREGRAFHNMIARERKLERDFLKFTQVKIIFDNCSLSWKTRTVKKG